MKIGIMQPYFMPYISYFQLINAVDKFVVYDDVNYIKGGWANRNNILMNEVSKLFTIKLEGASPNKLFNEIFIIDDFVKLRKTLYFNYSKAPFYNKVMVLLNEVFQYPNKNLALFIFNSFQLILKYLELDKELILSSSIVKNNRLKGEDKILDMCNVLHANTYINSIGGKNLYNREQFSLKGVELKFLQTKQITYPQFRNEFVPDLSIIDVLMFNNKEETRKMLDKYDFV